MKKSKADIKRFGSFGPVSEGEAIIQFFSLTAAAEIFTWERDIESNHVFTWVIDKTNPFDKNIVLLYSINIDFASISIAERDLRTETIQIKSEKDYDRLSRYYDLSSFFECGSFTKRYEYDIILKPRLVNCLECEECLSCLAKGWTINKSK